MTLEVTFATADSAMRQAVMTADEYLCGAIERIDARLGKGYAALHPDLIAAFMRTAAQDFHTALVKVAAQDMRDELCMTIDSFGGTIEKALADVGTAVETHAASLDPAAQTIAAAIDGLAARAGNVAEMLDLHSCGRPPVMPQQ